MLGYGLQLQQITPAVVREVASDFRLDQSATLSEEKDNREGLSAALKFLHPMNKEEFSRPTTTPIERTTFFPGVKSK